MGALNRRTLNNKRHVQAWIPRQTCTVQRCGSSRAPRMRSSSKATPPRSALDFDVVNVGCMRKLEEYYQHYVNNSNIATVFDIPAEHAFITDNYGYGRLPCVVSRAQPSSPTNFAVKNREKCDHLGYPFINKYPFLADLLLLIVALSLLCHCVIFACAMHFLF